jgi:hypothetical protein
LTAEQVFCGGASFDIFRLQDESLGESENPPDPEIIARKIVQGLESALEQFGSLLKKSLSALFRHFCEAGIQSFQGILDSRLRE